MQKVTTCLWFDHDGEAAAQFYVSLFEDSAIVNVARDLGSGSALVVDFTLAGTAYQILNGGPRFPQTEAASLSVRCADQAEVDRLWEALREGGQESRCGWLQDRWGVWWQIVPTRLGELLGDPDPGRAGRAMQAMLQMGKIDVAVLEAAADGGADGTADTSMP